ncbi:MAG: transcription factor E2F/DP domain containing protein [Amphiamblys sp. WSBS2006]|nr:MAG: transcription factor E2F/DP domain containing protein [Amphiamblys sp. WSBS2006]
MGGRPARKKKKGDACQTENKTPNTHGSQLDEYFEPEHKTEPIKLAKIGQQTTDPVFTTKKDPVDSLKGMRFFSSRICREIQSKEVTTYNEISDGITKEIQHIFPTVSEKNIRRRVYDALNVLIAAKIISKTKKEIRWIGLPNYSTANEDIYEKERRTIENRIQEKKKQIKDLVRRLVCFHNLTKKNRAHPDTTPGTLGHAVSDNTDTSQRITAPFVLIKTQKNTRIHCEMLENRTQYYFEFDRPFEIIEDVSVMEKIGHGTVDSSEELMEIIPKGAWKYITRDIKPKRKNTSQKG